MCAYCFWDQNPARACLLDTVHLYFWGKNPSCALNKCGLFSQIFIDFSTNYFPIFFPFYAMDTETQKLLCLVNFGYTGINYSVHLFHHVRLLKFGVFPPTVFIQYCAFIPSHAFIRYCRVDFDSLK